MTTSADGDLPPMAPRPFAPHVLPVPVTVESAVTKVARVFAIVRDMVIIALVLATMIAGSRILAQIDTASTENDGVGDEPAVACTSPSADQWGTFCETPGG